MFLPRYVTSSVSGSCSVPRRSPDRERRCSAGTAAPRSRTPRPAGLAAPARDVEGEAPDPVAAPSRLLRPGEDLAHHVEEARVGGEIRARGTADGPRSTETSRPTPSSSSVTSPMRVDLPEPETPVTAVSTRSGNAALTPRRLWRLTGPTFNCPRGERTSRSGAGERSKRKRAVADSADSGQLRHRTAVQHPPAVLTRPRTDVDEPVGAPHDIQMVLDHEHRVARRLQSVQDREQGLRVRRVQARGRFVEDAPHRTDRSATAWPAAVVAARPRRASGWPGPRLR